MVESAYSTLREVETSPVYGSCYSGGRGDDMIMETAQGSKNSYHSLSIKLTKVHPDQLEQIDDCFRTQMDLKEIVPISACKAIISSSDGIAERKLGRRLSILSRGSNYRSPERFWFLR